VYNKQIRCACDIYKKIAYMSAKGFEDESKQLKNIETKVKND